MSVTPQTTLREFFARVYRPLRLRGRAASTAHQYEIQFTHFHRFLGREPLLSDFTDDVVCAFLGSLRVNGRAAATANKARNHLLALWRFAARKRVLEQYPDVPADVEPDRAPLAWLPDELLRLFAACRAETGYTIAGVDSEKWWYALHLVEWDTGERIAALLGVPWHDVDLSAGWVTVRAELRKWKRRDKVFPLHSDTVASLKLIREPPRAKVFDWSYSRTYFWQLYGRLLRRARLPCDRRSKFHRMRRSVASWYEAAGGNATALLDHSSREVTLAYLDPRVCQPKGAAHLLFRPDQPKKPE